MSTGQTKIIMEMVIKMVVNRSKGRRSNSKHHKIEMSRYLNEEVTVIGDRVFSDTTHIGSLSDKIFVVFHEYMNNKEYANHIDYISRLYNKRIVSTVQ